MHEAIGKAYTHEEFYEQLGDEIIPYSQISGKDAGAEIERIWDTMDDVFGAGDERGMGV